MKVARSLAEVPRDVNTVVTVGTFDGVHLAHREIIRDVVNRANMKEGRSVVVTFDPHPRDVVAKSNTPVPLLTTVEERIEQIGGLNVDVLLMLEFTFAFSRQSSREFYRDYIVQGTGVDEVVVGYDHMFGRDREAGIEELVQMGKEFGFSVFAVHPVTVRGETVSSTRIREALTTGDVAGAAQFLGRPYALAGKVARGDGRGKTIGFPTANLVPLSPQKVVPARGVYAVAAEVKGEHRYGMTNIGTRPTVSSGQATMIEVHLFDYDRDIYGETVNIAFLRRLRDEKKFGSLEELTAQLHRDRDEARRTAAGLA
jgi:riboflavin kinase/FMN adenylyltransferase